MKLYSLLIVAVFLTILCSCNNNSLQQGHIELQVYLENAPFDSLFVYYYTDENDCMIFKGEHTGQYLWKFTLPDSLPKQERYLRLTNQCYDQQNNLGYEIGFYAEPNENKNYFYGFFAEDSLFIHAVYDDQKNIKETIIVPVINGKIANGMIAELISYRFKVLNNDSSEFFISSQQPYFSRFIDSYDENKSYNDFLEEYVAFSKKYPDSKYLFTCLSDNLMQYHSKADVLKVYANLSDKYKSTEKGLYIERFLNAPFENMTLLTLDKKKSEFIISDTSKFNLVVFTASWCLPCREEIPLLKQIYRDLKGCLIITYISTDEEDTVDAFQKLMQIEQIPWRALLSFQEDYFNTIKKKYFIDNGIPHGILVYPDGNWQVLDVRNDEQRDELYSLNATNCLN
jgi:thiol-disulfide isomerase/thioredoxin